MFVEEILFALYPIFFFCSFVMSKACYVIKFELILMKYAVNETENLQRNPPGRKHNPLRHNTVVPIYNTA